MARPRKNDPQELVRIVDEFFENEVNGNPALLKCSKIGEFAKKKGYGVEAYHFRRDEEVRRRIEELKEILQDPLKQGDMAAYKSLDVEGIVESCSSLEQLKRQLYEIDSYWKEHYQTFADVDRKYQELLRDVSKIREAADKYRREAEGLAGKLSEAQNQVNKLSRENVYLRRMLRKHLYPGLANELLREARLPVPENDAVKPESMKILIEGKMPQVFDGLQGQGEKPKSRKERLMEALESQVERNGRDEKGNQ